MMAGAVISMLMQGGAGVLASSGVTSVAARYEKKYDALPWPLLLDVLLFIGGLVGLAFLAIWLLSGEKGRKIQRTPKEENSNAVSDLSRRGLRKRKARARTRRKAEISGKAE